MIQYLWKVSRYSTSIRPRCLEYVFKPVKEAYSLITEMFSRRSDISSSGTIPSYDYGHRATDTVQPARINFTSVWATHYDSKPAPTHSANLVEPAARWGLPPADVTCGELRSQDAGKLVRMTGRVKKQKVHRFIALRDSHGCTQLVVPEENTQIMIRLRDIPDDSHLEIIGTVRNRPGRTTNPKMSTGKIEVLITQILDVFAPKRMREEVEEPDTTSHTAKKPRSLLLNSEEVNRCETRRARKKFQERTHCCGDLSMSDVGAHVKISGWVESLRSEYFSILRDGRGEIQLVHMGCDQSVKEVFHSAKLGTLLQVTGKVQRRPTNKSANQKINIGLVEVKVETAEVIDTKEPDSENEDNGTSETGEEKNENDDNDQKPKTKSIPPGDINSYCDRTHTCGELNGSHVGKDVVLCGWMSSKRTNRFCIIRDGHGLVQLLLPPQEESDCRKIISEINLESVVRVTGTVCGRPESQATDRLPTGDIEVMLKDITVLNPAKKDIPFIVRANNRPKEPLRMKYRYIDLRFSDMQFRLRLRSKILMKMREFLINHRGFVEIETPTLFRGTPGGAQEYVVPTRTEGKFYSLVQSPQQLKQLLMIGAMDRYFQVARCYRDEGARPDRQPEFTQLDIELSFTNKQMIMNLIEDLLTASIPSEFSIVTPFTVLKYHEAMHWYGSDKPDISFDKKLIDISEAVENKDLLPNELGEVKDFTAKAIYIDTSISSDKIEEVLEDCEDVQKMKCDTRAKMIKVRLSKDNWREDLTKKLPFVNVDKLKDTVAFRTPSTLVVGMGQENQILPLMGKLRYDLFHKPTPDFHFAWVVDFPLFLERDDGTAESAHHPFTQPMEEDVHLLDKDPFKVRSLHFDLVLNGFEVGGGSVRIHDPVMQRKILKDVLKIPTGSLEHLLEALDSGAPPHGGIALGIDRLLAIIVDAESIRDVIAFPKGVDGKDPLSGAPCAISDNERKIYHLGQKKEKGAEDTLVKEEANGKTEQDKMKVGAENETQQETEGKEQKEK